LNHVSFIEIKDGSKSIFGILVIYCTKLKVESLTKAESLTEKRKSYQKSY
ncbi:32242_t:CDS:1, partial [Racocetra persica]